MALDLSNPIFLAPPAGSPNPELLLSAVLHLMSHYTAHAGEAGGCVKLAAVIERHLKALSSLPGLAPVLRATCRQLSDDWASVVERTLPPASATKGGILGRIMARARPLSSEA
ncbi:MAG: hypothetical protein ACEQSK_07325 [Sphingomonadaceae bacterium]